MFLFNVVEMEKRENRKEGKKCIHQYVKAFTLVLKLGHRVFL